MAGSSKPRTARTPENARAKKPATKAKKRTPKKKPDWAPRWLKAFEETGIVSEACRVAQVGRTTVYERRQSDEDFALAWYELELRSTELMEAEAVRRARIGVEEPVYQKGECVGHIRRFSDTLLIFMLKARKPEVYRETFKHEHSGKVDHEHSVDLSKLSEADLDDLERITAAATSS